MCGSGSPYQRPPLGQLRRVQKLLEVETDWWSRQNTRIKKAVLALGPFPHPQPTVIQLPLLLALEGLRGVGSNLLTGCLEEPVCELEIALSLGGHRFVGVTSGCCLCGTEKDAFSWGTQPCARTQGSWSGE